MDIIRDVRRLISALLIITLLSAFPAGAAQLAGAKEPVRAVTYAGKEWVINFWSTEMDDMDEDFDRIRADGFNTIIVCVPWREFQPYAGSNGFQKDAFTRLGTVLEKAQDHGLSVMLRLGYTWDYYDNSDILKRYQSLLTDESTRQMWLSYAAKVYQTVSAYPAFSGAFLTWEDFWNFVETEKQIAGTSTGRKISKESGYTKYVLSHYDRAERVLLYGSGTLADTPEFASPESPAYRFFLDWYDSFLSGLLEETQTVFPDLSMECRLDQDPYLLPDGETAFYDHSATFPCGNASYASVMLSASMGFADGQALSAPLASAKSSTLLATASQAARKPVFVDQFLYMETTPGYERLAGLLDSEVNPYLEAMGGVFAAQTTGYGIWTYRDYADNLIYNPEFGRDLLGWDATGGVSAVEQKGSRMAKLGSGMRLSQDLSYRNYMSDNPSKLQLRAVSDDAVKLTVTLGGVSKTVTVAGDQVITIAFDRKLADQISFTASGTVYLDDIKLYSHVTEGKIYGIDGSEKSYLAGIRALNRALGA